MDRIANSIWRGSIQGGKGEITTGSGALKATPYSFATRFGETPGTNPEELIAAAHSGCYAMALSGALGKAKFEPKQLDVRATVTLSKSGDSFSISHSRLSLKADIPGIDKAKFLEIAEDAKKNCPVSKVLNAEISLDAELISSSVADTGPRA
jgi:osmotically inducible protein OsmC